MFVFLETPKFQRDLKKFRKKNKNLFRLILKTLDYLRFDPKLPALKSHVVGYSKTHKMSVWSSWVTGDVRILWCYTKDNSLALILVRVGGHDEVYRK